MNDTVAHRHWVFPTRIPGRVVPVFLTEGHADAAGYAQPTASPPLPQYTLPRFTAELHVKMYVLALDLCSNAGRVFHSEALSAAASEQEQEEAGEPEQHPAEVVSVAEPSVSVVIATDSVMSTGSGEEQLSTGSGEDEAQNIVGEHIEFDLTTHGIDDVSPGALQRQLSQASILREAGRVARFQTMLEQPNLDMGEYGLRHDHAVE